MWLVYMLQGCGLNGKYIYIYIFIKCKLGIVKCPFFVFVSNVIWIIFLLSKSFRRYNAQSIQTEVRPPGPQPMGRLRYKTAPPSSTSDRSKHANNRFFTWTRRSVHSLHLYSASGLFFKHYRFLFSLPQSSCFVIAVHSLINKTYIYC